MRFCNNFWIIPNRANFFKTSCLIYRGPEVLMKGIFWKMTNFEVAPFQFILSQRPCMSKYLFLMTHQNDWKIKKNLRPMEWSDGQVSCLASTQMTWVQLPWLTMKGSLQTFGPFNFSSLVLVEYKFLSTKPRYQNLRIT